MLTMRGRTGHERGNLASTNVVGKVMGLGYFAAWAVLFVSLLITLAAWRLARNEIERSAHSRFDARSAELEAVISGRLLDYRQVLHGAAGLFAASKSVERDEWQAYVQSLNIENGYPGLQGLGFAQWISAAEKNTHIRQVRAEGFPAYDIWPAGERAEYAASVFLEPFVGRNLRAFGYDMYAEPTRRRALARARDLGIITASAKVTLVQETDEAVQAGFLMVLPVYRPGAPTDTLQARRAALQGFVYSPFRMNDLMRGILAKQAADLDLEIYDGVRIDADTLMYRRVPSQNALGTERTPTFTRTLTVDVGGHTWTMRFASLAAFDAAAENDTPAVVLIAGMFISALFMALASMLANRRSAALALANEMTASLRASEERFRVLAEISSDWYWEQDSEFRFTLMSDGIDKSSTLSSASYIGKTRWEIPALGMSGDDWARHRAMLEARQEFQDLILQRLDGNGRRRYLRVNGRPMFDVQGNFSGYRGTGQDITELKEAEASLRDSEGRLRAIADNMPVLIAYVDADQRYRFNNQTYQTWFGMAPSEIFGRHVRDVVGKDNYENARPYIEAVLTGEKMNFESVLVTGGLRRQVEVIYIPRFDELWAVVGFYVLSTDITERKRAEEAVRASKERLELGLAGSDLALFEWDTATGEMYLSEAWSVMLGGELKPTQTTFQAVRQLVHPDDAAEIQKQIRDLLKGNQPFYRAEHRVMSRSGEWKWIQSLGKVAARDAQGRALRVTGTNADITERKAVERMKSEFVANVSHELRTPLTAIIGSLGVIQSDMLDEVPQHVKVFLDMAAQNSERLASLINDILDTEKIESGLISFQFQPVPVNSFLQHAIDLNRAYAEHMKVRFELVQPVPDANLRADSSRLMQVLTNLLANAAKFSPAGASVAISARQIDDKIRVSVSDCGPGVPEEFRDRIFQKFAQADASDTRRKGGSGLGLNISKAIVEKMGGSIGYDSVAGQGATFYFELPQWRERGALTAAEGGDRRVLICEDERDTAELIAVYLKHAGFVADTAYSAGQAKQFLAEQRYCAMTLDLLLPDEHGASLIRAVRANPATSRLPIIIVSPETGDARDALAHLEVSVSAWVDKPFTAQGLVDAVERALVSVER
jgi:PAS domain S-box-containing protein